MESNLSKSGLPCNPEGSQRTLVSICDRYICCGSQVQRWNFDGWLLIWEPIRWDDGNSLGPKEVHNYLTRVMYNRRNKFDPLWNPLVLGGVKKGQKYLGMISVIGVNFEDNHVATGFGNRFARPILRDEWHENLTFEEGVKLLEKCMRSFSIVIGLLSTSFGYLKSLKV